MSGALWKIVLKETFLSVDIFVLLFIPVLAVFFAVVVFKKSPLKNSDAWFNVGRRYLRIGCIFTGTTFIAYLISVLFAYANIERDNRTYTFALQSSFRDYYSTKKSYTQRLIDFAQRVENTNDILAEMDNFATNLPRNERETFGRAWVASQYGGGLVKSGTAFSGIEERLYWPDEKVAQYKENNGGILPAAREIRYTKAQIVEYKKSNWSKLYPMLEQEQWFFIKNQILDIKNRDNVLGFLRDVANCFQRPNPTDSLNSLYERISDKACPSELQKLEFYLEGSPRLLLFYKFSLGNRWWFRTVAIAVVFILAGIAIIFEGREIALEGKKRIFK